MKRVLIVAALLVSAGSAHAEMSEAQQRMACGSDVMRLCFFHIPNRTAISDCMVAKKDQLGPVCRKVVDAGLAEKANVAAR